MNKIRTNWHTAAVCAIKMSEIFHTSMDYIMCLSPTEHADNSDCYVNDEQRDYLLRCYRRLGSKNKARLVSYAEGLLDSQKD